ncbi:hypothetical protein HDU93_007304 [Gonapodya sp. JEL0774]|nr:hypothetical protein HDU93_007304 [Gonapodya sp. JEL0774]
MTSSDAAPNPHPDSLLLLIPLRSKHDLSFSIPRPLPSLARSSPTSESLRRFLADKVHASLVERGHLTLDRHMYAIQVTPVLPRAETEVKENGTQNGSGAGASGSTPGAMASDGPHSPAFSDLTVPDFLARGGVYEFSVRQRGAAESVQIFARDDGARGGMKQTVDVVSGGRDAEGGAAMAGKPTRIETRKSSSASAIETGEIPGPLPKSANPLPFYTPLNDPSPPSPPITPDSRSLPTQSLHAHLAQLRHELSVLRGLVKRSLELERRNPSAVTGTSTMTPSSELDVNLQVRVGAAESRIEQVASLLDEELRQRSILESRVAVLEASLHSHSHMDLESRITALEGSVQRSQSECTQTFDTHVHQDDQMITTLKHLHARQDALVRHVDKLGRVLSRFGRGLVGVGGEMESGKTDSEVRGGGEVAEPREVADGGVVMVQLAQAVERTPDGGRAGVGETAEGDARSQPHRQRQGDVKGNKRADDAALVIDSGEISAGQAATST